MTTVRVLASLAACTLFASLLPAIQMVNRQKSTASFPSILPVLSMVANCVAWGLYGLLIEDYFPLVATNMVGLALSLFYLAVYYHHESNKSSLGLEILITTLLLVGLVLYPFVAAHDGVDKKIVTHIVGTITVTITSIMFGSPLVLLKRVIQERNTNLLPLTMIIAGAVNCVLWLVYGLLLHDVFVIVPNAANLLLGIVQLGLFCIYPRGETYDTVDSAPSESKLKLVAKSNEVSKTLAETEGEMESSVNTKDELSSLESNTEPFDTSTQQSTTSETTIKML